MKLFVAFTVALFWGVIPKNPFIMATYDIRKVLKYVAFGNLDCASMII